MAQKGQAFESVTLGHIRSHGCRDLLVYCSSIHCSRSAAVPLPFCNVRPFHVSRCGESALPTEQCRTARVIW